MLQIVDVGVVGITAASGVAWTALVNLRSIMTDIVVIVVAYDVGVVFV